MPSENSTCIRRNSGKEIVLAPHFYVIGNGPIGQALHQKLRLKHNSQLISRQSWSKLTAFEPPANIIITVKAPDIPEVIELLKPRILRLTPSSSTILFVQNGIGILDSVNLSELQSHVTIERMTIWFGASIQDTLKIFGEACIALISQSRLISTLESCGFSVLREKDVQTLEWKKAFANIGINAICALSQSKNGEILKNTALRAQLEALLKEAFFVAQAEGITLHSYEQLLNEVLEVTNKTGENLNSTLMDLRRHRKTEIPWLNGMVSKLGKTHGIATPMNDAITNQILALEN